MAGGPSGGPPAGAVSTGELVGALAQFVFSSVVMVLGNKKAVTAMPLACTLVIIQALGTLLLLQLPYCRKQTAPWSLSVTKRWLPIAGLFSTMIFTSLKSFQYSSVSTVLVFRNIASIVTSVVEYFIRGTPLTPQLILSEIAIVVGAVMYGRGAVDFSWVGLFWIMTNVFAQVAYGVLIKVRMDAYPDLAKLSKFSMSRYNNALCLPMIAAILVVQGELPRIESTLHGISPEGWAYVVLTCLFGFLISTSGFGLQRLVSATTFIIVNNLAKFFNILLGVVLMGDQIRGPIAVSGCVLALLAGVWYSFEQTRISKALAASKGSAPAPESKNEKSKRS
jgi:hypothetical protein